MPLLAVPQLIPVLRGEFHLSGTEIGILTGLPIILFAAAA
jgi:CP family cyanate transporter-like MFS transporter